MNELGSALNVLQQLARHRLRFRLQGGRSAAPNVARMAASIARQSYVVVPGFIPREQCALLREQIDKLMVRFEDCVQVDPAGSDHRLFGAQHGAVGIRAFHDEPFFLAVGAAHCRRTILNFATLAGRLEARTGNRGSGQGWHRDQLPRQFKAIAYLTDVDVGNGPFQIIPGSHRTPSKVMHTFHGGLDPASTRIPDEQIARLEAHGCGIDTVVGEAGSVLLVDTSAIHRGMPIRQGQRYALTNYYYLREELAGREAGFPKLLTADRMASSS